MGPLFSAARFFRLGAASGLISILLANAAFADDTLVVTADQARVVKVPATARTFIVGNPMIADVTLLKKGMMVVTAKGFGKTNLIALDSDGNPVAQSDIEVVGGANGLVVQRGMQRESYTCDPRCQPTARLGDDSKYFDDVTAQMQARNAQASGR